MWYVKKRLFNSKHSFSKTPVTTLQPASCKRLTPCPDTLENVSIQPITTLGILCLMIRSTQGGVFPKWLHGSKETYIVAFLSNALFFTACMALTSA